MRTLSRSLLVPALWLGWCLLATWACLPALDGPDLLGASTWPADIPGSQLLVAEQGQVASRWRGALPEIRVLNALNLLADPRGQKVLGLALHILIACVVLLLSRRLFAALGPGDASWPAFAAAATWLVLPLSLSTVFHAAYLGVQLTTLGVLCSLLAYCQARVTANGGVRRVCFLACGAAALLAGLASDNPLMALSLLLLAELFVFRFRGVPALEQRPLWGVVLLALVVVVTLLLRPGSAAPLFPEANPGALQGLVAASNRLADYAGQVLWVDVHALGPYRGPVVPASGLLAPPRGAVVMLPVLVALVYSALTGRGRVAALGVAFFLVAQVIQLPHPAPELPVEQGNYLASLGLVWSLVGLGAWLHKRYPVLAGWPALLLIILLGRNLLLLGSQAVIWSDNRLLHMEALNNHPESRQAQLALARVFARDDNLVGAMRLLDPGGQGLREGEAAVALQQALFYCLAQQPLPAGHFSKVPVQDNTLAQPLVSVAAAEIAELVLKQQCPRADAIQFADAIGEWSLAGGTGAGSGALYLRMMLVERQLGRSKSALRYERSVSPVR